MTCENEQYAEKITKFNLNDKKELDLYANRIYNARQNFGKHGLNV